MRRVGDLPSTGTRRLPARLVEALDVKRGNLMRRIHQLRTQSQTNPRQGAALPAALEQFEAATRARQLLYEGSSSSVRSTTDDAELCDAAWRVADEDARDRRLIIGATQFVPTPGLLYPRPGPLRLILRRRWARRHLPAASRRLSGMDSTVSTGQEAGGGSAVGGRQR